MNRIIIGFNHKRFITGIFVSSETDILEFSSLHISYENNKESTHRGLYNVANWATLEIFLRYKGKKIHTLYYGMYAIRNSFSTCVQ